MLSYFSLLFAYVGNARSRKGRNSCGKTYKMRKVLKCVTILLGEKIQLIYNLVTTKIITHGVFFILHFHRLVGSEECK